MYLPSLRVNIAVESTLVHHLQLQRNVDKLVGGSLGLKPDGQAGDVNSISVMCSAAHIVHKGFPQSLPSYFDKERGVEKVIELASFIPVTG